MVFTLHSAHNTQSGITLTAFSSGRLSTGVIRKHPVAVLVVVVLAGLNVFPLSNPYIGGPHRSRTDRFIVLKEVNKVPLSDPQVLLNVLKQCDEINNIKSF